VPNHRLKPVATEGALLQSQSHLMSRSRIPLPGSQRDVSKRDCDVGASLVGAPVSANDAITKHTAVQIRCRFFS